MKNFQSDLQKHFDDLKKAISSENGDWVVKGFIDIYKNIYTISDDTKVVSKIVELMIFPILLKFAVDHNYKMILSKEQNHYPDITFKSQEGDLIALDLKSTYRKNKTTINGMTLGAFSGYFRFRDSNKNVTFPYQSYSSHYVLGVIYSRRTVRDTGRIIYNLDNFSSIVSVVKDFDFALQEKWKIAIDRPGSGNTKNIGSVNNIDALVNGKGPFSTYGVEVFDDYWMNYLTNDMARTIGSKVPYHNLDEYFKDRGRCYKKT
jgi:hypothetical protein